MGEAPVDLETAPVGWKKKVQDEVYVFMKFEVSNKVAMEKRAKDRSDK